MKRVRILVSGRVQGVCFRAYTLERARSLGLSGYVRNLPDGRVEIEAQGPQRDLDALVDWASRGPSYARVIDVDFRQTECIPDDEGFEIRY